MDVLSIFNRLVITHPSVVFHFMGVDMLFMVLVNLKHLLESTLPQPPVISQLLLSSMMEISFKFPLVILCWKDFSLEIDSLVSLGNHMLSIEKIVCLPGLNMVPNQLDSFHHPTILKIMFMEESIELLLSLHRTFVNHTQESFQERKIWRNKSSHLKEFGQRNFSSDKSSSLMQKQSTHVIFYLKNIH